MNDDVNACDYLRSMDTHCRGCEMKDMYERPRVSQWLFVLIRIGTRIVRRLTMWFQIQSQSRNLIWHEGTGWGRRIWGSRQYHAHFWSIWRWNIISKGSCLFLASVYMCGASVRCYWEALLSLYTVWHFVITTFERTYSTCYKCEGVFETWPAQSRGFVRVHAIQISRRLNEYYNIALIQICMSPVRESCADRELAVQTRLRFYLEPTSLCTESVAACDHITFCFLECLVFSRSSYDTEAYKEYMISVLPFLVNGLISNSKYYKASMSVNIHQVRDKSGTRVASAGSTYQSRPL